VHVDFSVESNALVFLRASECIDDQLCDNALLQSLHGTMRLAAAHQKRLAQQARPTVLRLLREFGASLPKEFLEQQLAGEAASDVKAFADLCAQQSSCRPRCICGMRLDRVTGHERAVKWCQMNCPDLPEGSERYCDILARFSETSSSYCDLCNQNIAPGDALWTCQNGNTTIFHANAFDVCDQCLVLEVAQSLDC
jgi:hypothetical protein